MTKNLIPIICKELGVEVGLPYNCVRITADFDCWGHKEMQATKVISMNQYQQIIAYGYYES